MSLSADDLEAGPEAVTDTITPPPVPDTDAMLSGIIGEIARAGSDDKEVNPVAVAAACLSWLSADWRHPAPRQPVHAPHWPLCPRWQGRVPRAGQTHPQHHHRRPCGPSLWTGS